ncbi:preprotein translocase subunit SecE [Haloglycomyces albus]|uniref:preprotein translocase subunit SecE n=1 Tax=Haloglycomyces albus TaxID=526067 RepID=UPI00046C8C17|nr:preprotein translocase subunit SecE [Haloglycomyces albus]
MADNTAKAGKNAPRPKKGPAAGNSGPLARLALFFRQVIEQLRKVVYPTRKQLITYSIVVLVFVLVMMAYIGGIDWVFKDAMQRAFGAKTDS